MIKKKSQSSLEFILLVGFLAFFFSLFFLAVQVNISDKITEKNNHAVTSVMYTAGDEIVLAMEADNGYFRTFKLPEKIEEMEYNISLVDNMIYIQTTNKRYSAAIPVLHAEGQIKPGQNIIQKKGGIIYLNE